MMEVFVGVVAALLFVFVLLPVLIVNAGAILPALGRGLALIACIAFIWAVGKGF